MGDSGIALRKPPAAGDSALLLLSLYHVRMAAEASRSGTSSMGEVDVAACPGPQSSRYRAGRLVVKGSRASRVLALAMANARVKASLCSVARVHAWTQSSTDGCSAAVWAWPGGWHKRNVIFR